MALTGSLIAMAMLLGAQPGLAGEPYGAEPHTHQAVLPPPNQMPLPDEVPLQAESATASERPRSNPLHPREESPSSSGRQPSDEFAPPAASLRGWSVSQTPSETEPKTHDVDEAAARPVVAALELQESAPASSLKLAPPTKSGKNGVEGQKPPSSASALTSVMSSLAVVVGLFFIVAWLAKRNAPKGAMLLPSEVVEVLGRTPLTSRQQMHVVRFGNKLLLLSVTPGGAEPLAEIENPQEVDRLTGICQELQQGSITDTFRQVFSQFAQEPAQEGFVGSRNNAP